MRAGVRAAAAAAAAQAPALVIETDGRIAGAGLLPAVLGYGIVVGAVVARVPQALEMWRDRSCAGLNTMSHEIEMFVYLTMALNGLRMSAPTATSTPATTPRDLPSRG